MRLYALPMIALALAACSDNNPATDGGPDGSLPDANKPDVTADAPSDAPGEGGGDAGPAVVSGTLYVVDTTLDDPAAAGVTGGINGGAALIEFDNTSDGKGGKVVSGTSPIGDCVVTQYDPTHLPHGQLDGDAITIADAPGDAGTTTGLLKTVGPCTYNTAFGGYACVSKNDTNVAVTAAGNNTDGGGTPTVAYVFPGTPFAGQNLVGSQLVINGFTNAGYNSGTAMFPIIMQAADNTLVVYNPTGAALTPEAATTGISDTIFNAAGPIPIAGPTAADFLGTGSISIAKPANTVWPAINFTVDVPGEGWTLSDPGHPYALPLTGTAGALSFGCGNGTPNVSTDDTCGDGSTAALQVMLISGTATKQSVASLSPFAMPKEVPGTDTWLTFQCAYLGKHTAVLTAAAGQAIIDFVPTRVELQVTIAAGEILQSGGGQTNVIVGHTIVGHTDHP